MDGRPAAGGKMDVPDFVVIAVDAGLAIGHSYWFFAPTRESSAGAAGGDVKVTVKGAAAPSGPVPGHASHYACLATAPSRATASRRWPCPSAKSMSPDAEPGNTCHRRVSGAPDRESAGLRRGPARGPGGFSGSPAGGGGGSTATSRQRRPRGYCRQREGWLVCLSSESDSERPEREPRDPSLARLCRGVERGRRRPDHTAPPGAPAECQRRPGPTHHPMVTGVGAVISTRRCARGAPNCREAGLDTDRWGGPLPPLRVTPRCDGFAAEAAVSGPRRSESPLRRRPRASWPAPRRLRRRSPSSGGKPEEVIQ